MAKDEARNGQREYGIVHVMEEEMRAAGQGVFAKRASAPQNKMESAPDNKADDLTMSMTKAELTEAAEADGVKLDGNETKADLIAKIEKARK